MPLMLRKLFLLIYSYFYFIHDWFYFTKLIRLKKNKRFKLPNWKERWICLKDRVVNTEYDSHYIYHTAWASRIIKSIQPKEHVDISSTLFFSTTISAFVPVRFYDIRPPIIKLDNLETGKVDLISLPFEDESFHSLTCMHVVEHIGLGRYGDQVDPDGDLMAMKELERVTAKLGNLLFVVPVGIPKIQFNAHRIYSYRMICDIFSSMNLIEFSLIDDKGNLIQNASESYSDSQRYGCGCFWFQK